MARAAKISKRHESQAKKLERWNERMELENEIRTLAKRANERLRALERHDLTEASNAYRYIERRHFDKDSAITEDRQGRIKFDTALVKKTRQQLEHEVTELKRFLYEAKTSTVSGTEERYRRAFESYAKNKDHSKILGEISRSEFDAMVRTAGFKGFITVFGSSTIVDLIEFKRKHPEADMEKAFNEFVEGQDSATEAMERALPPKKWIKGEQQTELPD